MRNARRKSTAKPTSDELAPHVGSSAASQAAAKGSPVTQELHRDYCHLCDWWHIYYWQFLHPVLRLPECDACYEQTRLAWEETP